MTTEPETPAEAQFLEEFVEKLALFMRLKRQYTDTFGYPPYAWQADCADWVRRHAPTEKAAEKCLRAMKGSPVWP